MGLDMFAQKVPAGSQYDAETAEEIHYWRKNNALHGWMEDLYESKGGTEEFNCVPVQLTAADLSLLRSQIQLDQLKPRAGFFFGEQSYSDFEKEADLGFIEKALGYITDDFDIYYTSWW